MRRRDLTRRGRPPGRRRLGGQHLLPKSPKRTHDPRRGYDRGGRQHHLGLECRGLAQHPVDRPSTGDLPEQRGDERGRRQLHGDVPESRNLHLPVYGSRGGHDRADRGPVVRGPRRVRGPAPSLREPSSTFSGPGDSMPAAVPESTQLNTPELLEAFFERSQDGFFFMMLDQPVEWGPEVAKDAVLDYVFAHQRMTKVNPAMAEQFRAQPAELIGKTPSDFFRHDLAAGRRGWRKLFDAGHTHSITNERRLGGSTMWVEGDYMCFYDAAGRITGHFGIQRDVSDRVRALEELEQSRAELRALAARLQTTREEERTRIAREIHDELGQALTALKLDVAWLESRRSRNSAAFRFGDVWVTDRIDQTMQIVRRIASELRPSVLDQLGLEAAIESLVRETTQRTGIAVCLHADDFPRLPDEIASHAFRIIQEALTNVSRHSKATRVDVSVRRVGAVIILGVEDNGVGFTPQSLSGLSSLGLVGIRERALACGGTLMIRGEPGRGAGIAVTIPVPKP